MGKLSKICEKFKTKEVKEDSLQALQMKYFTEVLDLYTDNFFPHHEFTKALLAKQINEFNASYNYDGVALCDLDYHTRDDAWLVNQLKADGAEVPNEFARKYVETSAVFDAARCKYEQDLVRCYIEIYRDVKAEDFAGGIEFLRCNARTQQNYDKLFYQRVMQVADVFGVNQHEAAKAIELHGDLWRKEAMLIAFINSHKDYGQVGKNIYAQKCEYLQDEKGNYRYVFSYDYNQVIGVDGGELQMKPWQELTHAQRLLFRKWMNLREYEYYQAHKVVIDEVGTITPAMKMKSREVKALRSAIAYLEKACGYETNAQKPNKNNKEK